MTLRLSPVDDDNLARLARSFRLSKNMAAAAAIEIAAPKPNHTEFVRDATNRLLQRYAGLMSRLAEA